MSESVSERVSVPLCAYVKCVRNMRACARVRMGGGRYEVCVFVSLCAPERSTETRPWSRLTALYTDPLHWLRSTHTTSHRGVHGRYFMPLLMPLLQHLIDVSDHRHLDEALLSPEVGREGIQLWLVPPRFHGRRFDELFIAMQTQGILAMGLLRCPPADPPSDATANAWSQPTHPYVFSCPMQGTIIGEGDRVYVIIPAATIVAAAGADGSGSAANHASAGGADGIRVQKRSSLFSNMEARRSTRGMLDSRPAHSPLAQASRGRRPSLCRGAATAAGIIVRRGSRSGAGSLGNTGSTSPPSPLRGSLYSRAQAQAQDSSRKRATGSKWAERRPSAGALDGLDGRPQRSLHESAVPMPSEEELSIFGLTRSGNADLASSAGTPGRDSSLQVLKPSRTASEPPRAVPRRSYAETIGMTSSTPARGSFREGT